MRIFLILCLLGSFAVAYASEEESLKSVRKKQCALINGKIDTEDSTNNDQESVDLITDMLHEQPKQLQAVNTCLLKINLCQGGALTDNEKTIVTAQNEILNDILEHEKEITSCFELYKEHNNPLNQDSLDNLRRYVHHRNGRHKCR